MKDFGAIVIVGSNFHELWESLNDAVLALPADLSSRLRVVRKDYFARYSPDEMLERLNNRTISQILAEHDPSTNDPIAAGEIDGTRYRLYPAPKTSGDGATTKNPES